MSGRGTLHLGILIENMRREGFEFEIGPPKVITREVGSRCRVLDGRGVVVFDCFCEVRPWVWAGVVAWPVVAQAEQSQLIAGCLW